MQLCLVLSDLYEKPIANATCVLTLDGQTIRLTADGNGKLQQYIPLDTHSGKLIIQKPQTPFGNYTFPLKVGNLDPVDQVSGQVARLDNLGYFSFYGSPKNADVFESAVEEFQCDNGLSVDGVCGPATQAKLKHIYGC